MKVLLLTDCPPVWNLAPASRLLCLAREIARDEHRVRVLGSRTDTPATVQGVEVLALPSGARGGLRQAVFSFRRGVRDNLRWADALIVRGYWLAFWLFLSSAMQGKAIRIYDFHGFVWKEQRFCGRWARSLTTRFLEHMGLRLSSHVLCVSNGVQDELPLSLRPKASVLENGVQADAPEAGPADSAEVARLRDKLGLTSGLPVYAIVGHLGPWVNIKETVRAASKLAGSVELVVIGDGPSVREAEAEKIALSADNVRLAGRLLHEEMTLFLRHLCFACISPYDGSWVCSQKPNFFASRKVKEYFAAGKPVIVSDVRGRGDFLVDGETCLLYPAGDSHALAEKMKALVADKPLAAKLGQNGRKLAEKFSWTRLYRESSLPRLLRDDSAA